MHNRAPSSNRREVPEAPEVSPHAAATWQAILQRVADAMDVVVEDFLTELRGSSLYEDRSVEVADLRHTAHETFRYLLDRMMEKPMSQHQRDAAKRLGIRRAGQKIQLEDLMAAIRLDFVVLWRRIRATMRENEMPVLVDHTEVLLTTIESYIREVQLEFLSETARISRDARLATERYLSRLLNTTQLPASALAQIAHGLKVPVDGTFEVVVIHETAVLQVQEALAEQLATGAVLGYPFGSGYTVFQARSRNVTRLSTLCKAYTGGSVARVEGLGRVPEVVESLSGLLEYHTDRTGLVPIDQLWPAAMADTLTGLLPDFPQRYTAGLVELPAADIAEVLATIRSFLDNGSIKDTAESVNRHRNTVINRLKTFEIATGLDVKVPRDAVLATLILATPAMQMHK